MIKKIKNVDKLTLIIYALCVAIVAQFGMLIVTFIAAVGA